MKKVAAVLVVVLFAGSSAMGGVVALDPTTPTEIFNNSAQGPTQATFAVAVQGDQITSLSAGVFDLTVAGGPRMTFAFSPTGPCPPTNPFCEATGQDSNRVGLNFFALTPSSLPTGIGMLTVDATGAPLGNYQIGATGVIQDQALTEETVRAMGGMFTVIPEPATISLLALGALGLIRRRW